MDFFRRIRLYNNFFKHQYSMIGNYCNIRHLNTINNTSLRKTINRQKISVTFAQKKKRWHQERIGELERMADM